MNKEFKFLSKLVLIFALTVGVTTYSFGVTNLLGIIFFGCFSPLVAFLVFFLLRRDNSFGLIYSEIFFWVTAFVMLFGAFLDNKLSTPNFVLDVYTSYIVAWNVIIVGAVVNLIYFLLDKKHNLNKLRYLSVKKEFKNMKLTHFDELLNTLVTNKNVTKRDKNKVNELLLINKNLSKNADNYKTALNELDEAFYLINKEIIGRTEEDLKIEKEINNQLIEDINSIKRS